jgi:hypothetical protein
MSTDADTPALASTDTAGATETGGTFSLDLGPDLREMRDWVHGFAADIIRPAGAE